MAVEAARGQEIVEIDAIPRFDVVDNCYDHFYAQPSIGKPNGASPAARKKIMQEWRILEKHLPETIFVRVYEKQIDLLRAMIVGAAGTPYHDGLFFFDVAFPSDYPSHPPMVHYRSFGYRLNPNLYANGRVCLSLLNTWTGKKTEKWNPSQSTLLQVLLSIQALVLNSRPYFNEPGPGMWPKKSMLEKKSNAYTEDAFVLSCKTMLSVLRRPPTNFEALVSTHFRLRGQAIFAACAAYSRGLVKVGYYSDEGSSSSSSSSARMVAASDRFKLLMARIMPQLATELTGVGASLGNFADQLAPTQETAQSLLPRKKGGIAKKVIGMVKGVFLGLSKKKKKTKTCGTRNKAYW